MVIRFLSLLLAFQSLFSALTLCQDRPSATVTAAALEFPVQLQQGVSAGKTGVGTPIQAKLMEATLLNGTVIPRNAVFSGQVIESAAKTKDSPSRLSIRMETVSWKQGSVAVKVYFTAWYYPTTQEAGKNLDYGPAQSANRTWNGMGQYPDEKSKVYQPFPGGDSGKNSSVPDTPNSTTSQHRILMKDVESSRADDGTITLSSKRSNLKFDKITTYVLAAASVGGSSAK